MAYFYKLLYNGVMEEQFSVEENFIKEKLKQRPLNRRKLLRRIFLTVLMAVLFGTVASATILFLQPVISEYLYPVEDEPEWIILPENIIEEEILPEDMIADEREMQEIQWALEAQENPSEFIDYDLVRWIASDVIDRTVFGSDEFISINRSLMNISREAQKSMVVVTGLTADVNWINNVFESRIQTIGAIFWDTGRELLILADITSIRNADSIMLTFSNNRQYPAEIREYDRTSGFAVLTVTHRQLDAETLESVKVIELGNSAVQTIIGTPVIAVGRIINNADSTCYGHITSSSTSIHKVDAKYRLLTTNIYSSSNASGLLINLDGQLIGLIDNSHNTLDARNILSAIGISELRKLIEQMMNGEKKPYVGVKGIDVTSEAYELLGVPRGAYITEVVLDSPAMNAGLQMGDIVVKIGEADITTFIGFVNTLFDYKPEQAIRMTIKRQGTEDYHEFVVDVIAGALE